MPLTPKNWQEFQHYKNRAPAWIKLHRGLLDDFAFSRLPVASRALAPLLWLLASEFTGGKISSSLDEIAYRLHMTATELAAALKPLIDGGFFIDDSAVLAECKPLAIPEREKEEQDKREKDIRTVADATRPANGDFEKFWKAYPKRKGANPKFPAGKLFLAAVKGGSDPAAIIAGAVRCAEVDRDKIGTEFIPRATTWLRDRRWQDYLDGTEADAVRRADAEKLIAAKGWEWREGKWQKRGDDLPERVPDFKAMAEKNTTRAA